MPLYNDEPVLHDRLRRTRLVAEIARSVARCQPPQVFGVHGDWGLGKTSLLHQIQCYLTGQCPQQSDEEVSCYRKLLKELGDDGAGRDVETVRVVWFEAWRYQNEAVPVVALLHEMRSQLSWHIRLGKRLTKLASVAVQGALVSMEDLTKKIGFQASKFEKAGEKWEREHLAATLPSHTIREQLERAIHGLLSPGVAQAKKRRERRVVVMIDDLDRCDPEAAYRLLEGLKIYLTLPNCVFVLGMNQRIVEDAVAHHLPLADDGASAERAERATAYLEKLCQNVWRVPQVRDPKSFLLELLPAEMGVVRSWIDAAVASHRCLPPNPRRLKGLANLVQRFQDRLPSTQGPADDEDMIQEARLMLIVAYVYQFHHDLYRLWEANPEVGERLLRWARGYATEPDPAEAETEAEKKEQEALLLYQVLHRLRRVVLIRPVETKPTPEFVSGSAFPDPADAGVFWVQPLLHEAATAATLATMATVDEDLAPRFARYLHPESEEEAGDP